MGIESNWYGPRWGAMGVKVLAAFIPTTSDNVSNLSTVPGANVTAALDELRTWDYVINDRAELAARFPPVAGVFTIPSGTILIRGVVILNANERITFASGWRGIMQGFAVRAGANVIWGNIASAPLVSLPSNADGEFRNVDFRNDGANAALSLSGEMTLVSCSARNGSGAASANACGALSAAGLTAYNCVFTTNATANLAAALNVSTGTCHLFGGLIATGSTSCGIYQNGVSTLTAVGVDIQCNGSGYASVYQTAGNSEFIGCTVDTSDVAGAAYQFGSAASVKITGGIVTKSSVAQAVAGVWFETGTCVDAAISGVTFRNVGTAILQSTGAVSALRITDNYVDSTCTNGVSLTGAPAEGGQVLGNSFQCATPLVGATDTYTFRRANRDSSAWMVETAIV